MLAPPPFMPPNIQMQIINPEDLPKETLYVSNLNDKINKEDMKYALFFLFSQFGEIHKIVLKKNNKMRGQAFIVFHNLTSSTNARAALNGMTIFEKSMVIEFSRTRSFIFDQMEGNFHTRTPQEKKPSGKREQKTLKQEAKLGQQSMILDPDATSTLLAEDLPQIVTEEALFELFGQYPGLKSVQLVAQRKLAFIDYENEEQASTALRGLNGFLLTITAPLKLRYARRT